MMKARSIAACAALACSFVAGCATQVTYRPTNVSPRPMNPREPSSVQLLAARPFFILGQVNQAGGFPYQTGMTVQNAIAIAGGYTPRADEGAVLITRKSADGTRTFKVPVTTYVYPGDTIYIRERWF